MKLMRNLVLSLLILTSGLLFTQCKKDGSYATEKEINGNEFIHCDVANIKETVDLPLSELVQKCDMIKLEATPQSFMGKPKFVAVSENYIAIATMDRPRIPIKLFSRKGKYLRDIGKIGKGPGEYQSLYGIQLDEKANRIYLTPFANINSITVFDLDGNYLKQVRLPYRFPKAKVHVNNDIITVCSMVFNEKTPVVYQQKLNGEKLQECFPMPHQVLKADFSSEISSDNNATGIDYLLLPYGKSEGPDTLYHYNSNKNRLIPQFVISENNSKVPSWSREYSTHFLIQLFGDRYKWRKVAINKNTLKTNYYRLINDFYGGFEHNIFFYSNNGTFIATLRAEELIKKFEEAIKKEELNEKERLHLTQLKNSLNLNDNHVLFIGKMI